MIVRSLARSKTYLRGAKNFENSQREKMIGERPNGERFSSIAACYLNSNLCYAATIHGNVYECDRIVEPMTKHDD